MKQAKDVQSLIENHITLLFFTDLMFFTIFWDDVTYQAFTWTLRRYMGGISCCINFMYTPVIQVIPLMWYFSLLRLINIFIRLPKIDVFYSKYSTRSGTTRRFFHQEFISVFTRRGKKFHPWRHTYQDTTKTTSRTAQEISCNDAESCQLPNFLHLGTIRSCIKQHHHLIPNNVVAGSSGHHRLER